MLVRNCDVLHVFKSGAFREPRNMSHLHELKSHPFVAAVNEFPCFCTNLKKQGGTDRIQSLSTNTLNLETRWSWIFERHSEQQESIKIAESNKPEKRQKIDRLI